MDGLTLLRRAQKVGLAVQVYGDKLVIRGPKRAEPVALLLIEHKPEVLAALVPRRPVEDLTDAGPAVWREQYAALSVHWFLGGQRPWRKAQHVAFGKLLLAWHRLYGNLPEPDRCAGCGEDLPSDAGFVVDRDGTRVHFDGVRRNDCIIAYGARWRGAARAGLRALGIEPPVGEEAP